LLRLISLDDGRDWLVVTRDGLFDGSLGAREKVRFRLGEGLNVVAVDRFFQDFYRPGLLAAIWRGERPLPDTELGKNLPPSLKIVFPQEGGTVETDNMTIEAEAVDQGGGVRGPWLMHNGSRVLVTTQPLRTGKAVRRSFSVGLVEGENRLEICGATEDGSFQSEPVRLVLRYEKPLAKPAKPHLYLVAVGVNQYHQETMNLRFAARDAEQIADLFRERGPALYGADKVHVGRLLDERATKENIKAALRKVANLAKPQDALVLFLAGHGTMVGSRFYFIPHEFTSKSARLEDDIRQQGLPGDELDDLVSAVPALKRVVIYDTCQSGGAVLTSRSARDPFQFQKALETMSRSQGSFILAAASAGEEAQEVPELGHGVLTYTLLAALGAVDSGPLKRRPLSTSEDQSLLRVRRWFGFAQDEVPTLTKAYFGKEQFVRYAGEGADFPLLPLAVGPLNKP
jgi:hypothetical protein